MEKSFYEQMAEQEGVTELLKADRQMEWVGFMNNIYGTTDLIPPKAEDVIE